MFITLPITAKVSASLGYWLTPVLVDALSRQCGEHGTVFYNKFGKKTPDEQTEKTFLQRIASLGITSNVLPDTSFLEEFLSLCKDGLSSFPVSDKIQTCFRCSCGCLELPVSIASFAKQKTFTRVGDVYVCKVCDEVGIKVDVTTGFVDLQVRNLADIEVYPSWYHAEIADLIRQLDTQGLPVFKERETGFSFANRNLDVEFIWSQLPLLFSQRYSGERIRLVVTNHMLRQAVIALAIAKARNASLQVDLVVLPCIDHPGNLEKWDVVRLDDFGYTGDLMRVMLIGSLGWNRKNTPLFDVPSSMEYRRMALFQSFVKKASQERSPYSLPEAIFNLSQRNIVLGLKYVLSSKVFDYSTLAGCCSESRP